MEILRYMKKGKLHVKIIAGRLIILLTVILNISGCSKKNSDKVLRIGTEIGYPPFEYLDEDGKTLIGFDVDLWTELCHRLGMKAQVCDTQWTGILSGLDADRYDCIISAITITKERQERFLVTEPYVQNSECFIVNADRADKKIEGPEKLNGLKVAYQAETVSDVFVTDLIDNGADFTTFEYDKLLDAFDDLEFGRVDVVVAETAASGIIVRNRKNLRIDFVGEPDAFFGIMVSKNNPELFNKIQSALAQMKQDGFINSLEEKWLK